MALSPLGTAILEAQPQTPPPNRAQVNPTDVLGAYNLATNAANQQYALAKQQQMQTFGGLAGLGAAGITSAPAWYKLLKGIPDTPTINIGTTAASNVPTATANSNFLPSWFAPSQLTNYNAPVSGGTAATAFAPEAAAPPSLGAFLAAPDAAAGGTVAADMAALAPAAAGTDAALGAAAPAIAGGMSLEDILPFLFGLA